MGIGDKIALRRKMLGMSQEELAVKMGYKSKSSINKIEMGVNDIPQSKIVKFAEVLDTTEAYLMGWDEPKFSPTMTMIARAGSKKSAEDQQKMLQVLQLMFPEDFT